MHRKRQESNFPLWTFIWLHPSRQSHTCAMSATLPEDLLPTNGIVINIIIHNIPAVGRYASKRFWVYDDRRRDWYCIDQKNMIVCLHLDACPSQFISKLSLYPGAGKADLWAPSASCREIRSGSSDNKHSCSKEGFVMNFLNYVHTSIENSPQNVYLIRSHLASPVWVHL